MSTEETDGIEPSNGSRRAIPFIPEPTAEQLNERQQVDYRDHRERLIRWLLHFGKDPDSAEGYAHETVRRRAHDIDKFYRWVWEHETDGYTTQVTHNHADAYLRELVYADASETHKANTQKALKSLFRWRDDTAEWEPDISFSGDSAQHQPREYLTRDERHALCEASLEYGSVPHYNSLSPDERAEWKRVLAQRLRVPMDEVGPEEFDRANGFKIPSLVHVGLDAALRPIEIARATVDWVDHDNGVLRIPKSESSKNRNNWVVALRDRTARILTRWTEERECYDQYDETRRLWLTREANPYSSRSLNYLLDKLCEAAGIDTEAREISWYALRHSTGTYLAREDGLKSAASQLRHKSLDTTKRYDNTPPDERREALEQI